MKLIALILSLPTENATIRMRAWRALKASGAAVLRDGVYLMPAQDNCLLTLKNIASDVQSGGGVSHVLRVETDEDANFIALFDRSEDYAALLQEIGKVQAVLTLDNVQETFKQARKLRKAYAGLCDIDFFPGEARRQADAALQALELAANHVLSPDEPNAAPGSITRLQLADYQGRTWATRRRPWVDRLASAWLIRRFIDDQAQFLWLESPADCPAHALGFDFDGARFSHVGVKVTFETLLASFGLETPALARLGGIVHFLDAGGVQPAESSGVECVLAGLRDAITDDEQLLLCAGHVFDGLLAAFQAQPKKDNNG